VFVYTKLSVNIWRTWMSKWLWRELKYKTVDTCLMWLRASTVLDLVYTYSCIFLKASYTPQICNRSSCNDYVHCITIHWNVSLCWSLIINMFVYMNYMNYQTNRHNCLYVYIKTKICSDLSISRLYRVECRVSIDERK